MLSWKKSGTWGVNGYIPEQDMSQFKIYLPGDPCNYSRHGEVELINYMPSGRSVRTKHATLKAAKAKAYKLYRKAYPLPKAEFRKSYFGPDSWSVWLPVKHSHHAYYTNSNALGEFQIVDNTLDTHKVTSGTYANLGEVKRAIRRMYATFVKNGGLK